MSSSNNTYSRYRSQDLSIFILNVPVFSVSATLENSIMQSSLLMCSITPFFFFFYNFLYRLALARCSLEGKGEM